MRSCCWSFTCRAEALILVVYSGWGAQRLLQAMGAEQGAGAPELVHLQDLHIASIVNTVQAQSGMLGTATGSESDGSVAYELHAGYCLKHARSDNHTNWLSRAQGLCCIQLYERVQTSCGMSM